MKKYLEIFVSFVVLKLSIADHQPVIFQIDSSVIASEPMRAALPQNNKIIPSHYSYYDVVVTELPSVVTTSTSLLNHDTLPADLMEMAVTKLGIKKYDDVPTISQLQEYLGTASREETIDFVRRLAATETGISLIKSFLEANDYEDLDSNIVPIESYPTVKPNLSTEDTELESKTEETEEEGDLGLLRRIASYLDIFHLFPKYKRAPYSQLKKEEQQSKFYTGREEQHESNHQHHLKLQPIPVTNSLPNSFPIPYRPGTARPTPAPTSRVSHIVKEDRISHRQILYPTFDEMYLN